MFRDLSVGFHRNDQLSFSTFHSAVYVTKHLLRCQAEPGSVFLLDGSTAVAASTHSWYVSCNMNTYLTTAAKEI